VVRGRAGDEAVRQAGAPALGDEALGERPTHGEALGRVHGLGDAEAQPIEAPALREGGPPVDVAQDLLRLARGARRVRHVRVLVAQHDARRRVGEACARHGRQPLQRGAVRRQAPVVELERPAARALHPDAHQQRP
jgi:hypothetical protein